ncbi:MAG: FAD-dependent oxidoreductase [Lachnospiraceae bacterium]|jgi:hypothetical protein|nr:FAD-dependent oxidoreductase [Lachnospiraceae bacterium]
MIHMSQVKVPVDKILEECPLELVRHGIIGPLEQNLVKKAAAGMLRLPQEKIKDIKIERKSIDARKKQQIHYTYKVLLACAGEEKIVNRYGKNDVKWVPGDIAVPSGLESCHAVAAAADKKERTVVAGFGPAGIFAALELAKAGFAPIVLERGLDVKERQKVVDAFWQGGKLNTECNVQFGEGGAGTFSDGKLNTLVKDPSGANQKILRTFVEFGAPSEILYLQKPHIGTDRLKDVVCAMRKEIISLGGEIWFGARLEDIVVENGVLRQVLFKRNGKEQEIICKNLVLATGHSARDTFYSLHRAGILMEQKSFAVGIRVEHPQEMIGKNQYGVYYTKLPAADYKVTYQTSGGRGVYSFCMCPGGYVVNASSEEGRLAVNGMSYYDRDGVNANSAVVVTVSPEDFGGTDVLAGIEFQRRYERAAYLQAGGKIPVQLFGDFQKNLPSSSLGGVVPQIKGEYALGNVREILPKFIGDSIAEGIQAFGKRIRGYDREDAVLSGIESRTSSPVRILRDESFQANIRGVYPCGEGAGYAGGIMSAAMDGLRVADAIIALKN